MSSVTISDLPPEVLEKILDRLDDRASVLNCRLVNSAWNAATEKAMENLCLSIWTRWNPEETMTNVRKRPFPEIGSTPIFPYFPTRSLCFDAEGWEEYKKTIEAPEIEMFEVFKWFGSHLTSLWIEEMSLDRVQISIMFEEFVNIKALNISLPFFTAPKSEATVGLTGKSPPNLQYLRLKWNSIEDCDLVQWIVDQCSSQLISLETFKNRVYPRRWQSEPRRFLKLPSSSGTNLLRFTKLKLGGASSDILEQTVRLPLTFLSIHRLQDYTTRPITLKDIITFLNNFSGTLIQLYLGDIFLDRRVDGGIIPFNEFPRLSELFIWFLKPSDPNKNHLAYLHEVFLKRFPNLECLHLLNVEYDMEERGMEQVRGELDSRFLIQHCFQLCQKLETVTVNCRVADEDSLRRQIYEITVSRDGNQLWKLC